MKKIIKSLIIMLVIIILISSIKLSNYIDADSNKQYDINSNVAVNVENQIILKNFTKAYVSKIIDGDTIEVIIDSIKYKVRLIGIDCPEYTSKIEYYGKESTNYTTSLVYKKYVFIEKDISEIDKYGRLLRYIWLELPNYISENEIRSKMLNALLIKNGYATVFFFPPDTKYSSILKSTLLNAKENNFGLWNK